YVIYDEMYRCSIRYLTKAQKVSYIVTNYMYTFLPCTFIIAYLGILEQFVKYEPGMCGPLTDPAVGDDFFIWCNAFTLIYFLLLIFCFKGPVFILCFLTSYDGCTGYMCGDLIELI